MRKLQWSISHAVFVPEVDDEHKEIFEVVAELQGLLDSGGEKTGIERATGRLASRMAEHFAHEERLMRAARYESLPWHKHRHDAALQQAAAFIGRMERGDPQAGRELIEYVTEWLHDHTRVADRMMGAALRNHRRRMCKVTFQAGTKPLEACNWVDSKGEPFAPKTDCGKR